MSPWAANSTRRQYRRERREASARRKAKRRVSFAIPLVDRFIRHPDDEIHDRAEKHFPLDEEFVVDELVGHVYEDDGTLLFKVLWFGYPVDEATWELIRHFPRSQIVIYCKRRNLAIPERIRGAQQGWQSLLSETPPYGR